jgi:acylphosphatase
VPEVHTIRCEVHYSGRVQGVGFRWNACSIARDYSVTGFVRNLPDGRVHLVAEGDREEVERFLAAVADSMAGNIRHAETVVSPATGRYQSFETTR